MTTSEVDSWFADYDNPQKDLMQAVRKVIMGADKRMEETIKWQAPTFSYEGNLASFNPRSKKHVSLMFHNGASIPGDFPHLEGDGKEARTMKFADAEELESLKGELEAIVQAWCEMKAG